MKNTALLLFLFVLASTASYAQAITETDLVGKWNVVRLGEAKIKLTSQNEKMMETLRNAFLNATFEFKADKHFNMKIDFPIIDHKMKNVHWKYDAANSKIIVQEWQDRQSAKSKLMEIVVFNEQGKIYFGLVESPYLLEVEKQAPPKPSPRMATKKTTP
jgi:hypothetical protein